MSWRIQAIVARESNLASGWGGRSLARCPECGGLADFLGPDESIRISGVNLAWTDGVTDAGGGGKGWFDLSSPLRCGRVTSQPVGETEKGIHRRKH